MAKASKDKEIIDILHEYGVYIPTRTIWLESSQDDEGDEHGVNYSMLITFLKNLHLLESLNKNPITIVLHTGGGTLDDGIAIYDAIKSSPCHITIKVVGIAMSMGSIILQAAEHRILSEHARVMFHLGNGHAGGNHSYEALNAIKSGIALMEKADDIIYNKIKDKMSKNGKTFSRSAFTKMNYNGKWMNAQEAIDHGLADEIELPAN